MSQWWFKHERGGHLGVANTLAIHRRTVWWGRPWMWGLALEPADEMEQLLAAASREPSVGELVED